MGYFVKFYSKKAGKPSKEWLKETLISEPSNFNSEIKAEKIIEFLANSGKIIISGSKIYAKNKIEISSSQGNLFYFGNNRVSKTNNTSIEARGNSSIVGKGNVKITQRDGTITFSAR